MRLLCLEHSNTAFAWHATEAYLMLRERRLDYPIKAAAELVCKAASGAQGVAAIARQLREWTVS